MTKVKIGLRGLNPASLVEKANKIEAGLAWKTVFSKDTKALIELKQEKEALKRAIHLASFGDKRAIEMRKSCEVKIKEAFRRLAAFVNHESEGNEKIIHDAGFEIKETNNRPKPLLTPAEPKLKRTDKSGELIVSWKPVTNSRNYIIQANSKNPDNDKHWTTTCFSTKSRCIVSELRPGKTYWIRVRAIGTEGIGPPSEAVQIMAA